MHFRSDRLVTVVIVSALLSACSMAPPKQSALMKRVEGLEVTKRELETLVYGYANHFAASIEQAAGEIVEAADDPAVRRAAIEWNVFAPPQMMQACFNSDPLVGLVSATSFTKEMRAFFETGPGRDVFGPHQEIAVAVSRQLEDDVTRMVHEIWPTEGANELFRLANDNAAAHPIQDTRFVRGTELNVRALRIMGADVAGGLAAAGSMNEQMAALTQRANIMTAYLPRHVQWQTALIMENSRELIADATDSTLVAVREETFGHLDPIFTFLDGQRALVVQDLARERAAVLRAITAERSEVLISLQEERSQVLEAIAEQRDATMRDLNALTLEALDQLASKSSDAVAVGVDHVVLRVAQLLALPLLFLAGVILAAMLWIRNTVNRILEKR